MIAVAVISFLLLMTVVYLIARPYLVRDFEPDDLAQLEADRTRAAAQLRDLEMEFSTGKLTEGDYETQRSRREAELEAADRAFDQALGAQVVSSDDELEQLIAARKGELAPITCPSCDRPYERDDRFCRACGADLTEVTTR